jgi:ligand-binding sensor domain-containing protein
VPSLATNSAGHVFAGTDTGVYRTTDNGGNWSLVGVPGIRFGSKTIGIDSTGRIFAGTYGSGVYRSTDNGASWNAVNTGLAHMTIYALAINASEHIFVGTYGGVYRSTNNGGNWTTVNTGLSTVDTRGLAINSSGHLFAGTWGGGMFRSTNNGANWVAINNGLTMTYLSVFAINPSGHIYLSAENIFRSTNNGDLWVNTGASPGTSPSSLVINSHGCLFAGLYNNGVSRCTDNGGSWTSINSGLTTTNIGSVALDPNGYLYAGTSPATVGVPGVFRSSQSTPVKEQTCALPTQPVLLQNYPNPFNPVTNFQFSIVNSQLTVLKVYDVLGREVATLENEVKQPGMYAVQWDASNVVSGVYFYRIHAGDFVATRKLLLLK